MFAVLNRVAMAYNDLELSKYTCILNNVLYDSIRDKTEEVLSGYDIENRSASNKADEQTAAKQ